MLKWLFWISVSLEPLKWDVRLIPSFLSVTGYFCALNPIPSLSHVCRCKAFCRASAPSCNSQRPEMLLAVTFTFKHQLRCKSFWLSGIRSLCGGKIHYIILFFTLIVEYVLVKKKKSVMLQYEEVRILGGKSTYI